jgi:hypothetical protein
MNNDGFFMLHRESYIFASRGELAHLVERLHGMQKVTGSIPVFSTNRNIQTGCGFLLKLNTNNPTVIIL